MERYVTADKFENSKRKIEELKSYQSKLKKNSSVQYSKERECKRERNDRNIETLNSNENSVKTLDNYKAFQSSKSEISSQNSQKLNADLKNVDQLEGSKILSHNWRDPNERGKNVKTKEKNTNTLEERHLEKTDHKESQIDLHSYRDLITSDQTAQRSCEQSLRFTMDEDISSCTPLLDKTEVLKKRDSLSVYFDKIDPTTRRKTEDSQDFNLVERSTEYSDVYKGDQEYKRRKANTKTAHRYGPASHLTAPPVKIQENLEKSDGSVKRPAAYQNDQISSSESFLSIQSAGNIDQQTYCTPQSANKQISKGKDSFRKNLGESESTKRKQVDSQNIDVVKGSSVSFSENGGGVSRNSNSEKVNQYTQVGHSSISLLKIQGNFQPFNYESDNASDTLCTRQNAQTPSSESFVTVQSEESSEQLKPFGALMNKTRNSRRRDLIVECDDKVGTSRNQMEHSQNDKRSTETSFEYAVHPNYTHGKAKQPHRVYRAEMITYSSSEYGNETDYTQENSGGFQKDHWVTRKSLQGRANFKSAVRPLICEQLLSKGNNTHSSILCLLKKLMQKGETLIGKDYTYFMFCTVKQIMECTKKREELILAMTCKDFENCHKIESERGHISYIIDSEDGFLPALGVEEWECLNLFKQQRDIVCQRKMTEDDGFVDSVYIFIDYDGKPVRKEAEGNECQSDVDEISQPSTVTDDTIGLAVKHSQSGIIIDDKCMNCEEGSSFYSKKEDSEDQIDDGEVN